MVTWIRAGGVLRLWLVAAAAVAALSGCGRSSGAPPTLPVQPTPEPEVTSPVSPQEEVRHCELPPSSTIDAGCWKLEPELLEDLEAAITATTEADPGNFDFEDTRCGNCYYVRNQQAYYAELARQLQLRGVCSVQEHDEIALKSSNDWSEQFDILLASGHIRRGLSAYLYTCSPAFF